MPPLEMSHPSRPGHFGAPLSSVAEDRLATVADVMIPLSASWPRAGELVPHFVSERTSPADRDSLEALLEAIDGQPPQGVERWLARLESERPATFAELRAWVYQGYYTSGSVIDILDRVHGYHGAPQPLGYELPDDPRLPARPHGSYRATDEVSDVRR